MVDGLYGQRQLCDGILDMSFVSLGDFPVLTEYLREQWTIRMHLTPGLNALDFISGVDKEAGPYGIETLEICSRCQHRQGRWLSFQLGHLKLDNCKMLWRAKGIYLPWNWDFVSTVEISVAYINMNREDYPPKYDQSHRKIFIRNQTQGFIPPHGI